MISKPLFISTPQRFFLQTLLNIPRDLIYPKDSIEDSLQNAVLKAAGSTKGEIRFFGANASRAFPHSVRRKTHFAANRSQLESKLQKIEICNIRAPRSDSRDQEALGGNFYGL